MPDFGDEIAERLLNSTKSAVKTIARGIWKVTRFLGHKGWVKLHEQNYSVASEMADVMKEADEKMKSPGFEDGRVYDIGTGATLKREGEDVIMTFDFTDNKLPDGSVIDDFEGTKKDIEAQLKKAGAPDFRFDIEEGEGTLLYKYDTQDQMYAAIKETKLSFGAILDEAKTKEMVEMPVTDLAENHLKDIGSKTSFADMAPEEQEKILRDEGFIAYVNQFCDSERRALKAKEVDARVTYSAREGKVIYMYQPEQKEEFEKTRAALSQEKTAAQRNAQYTQRERERRARESGKESLDDKIKRVSQVGANERERAQREFRKSVFNTEPKPVGR